MGFEAECLCTLIALRVIFPSRSWRESYFSRKARRGNTAENMFIRQKVFRQIHCVLRVIFPSRSLRESYFSRRARRGNTRREYVHSAECVP